MVRTWTFTASGIPPGPNARLHWRARHRLTAPLRDEVTWQVKQAVQTVEDAPLQRVKVVFTIYRRGGRAMDRDNAVGCLKCCQDSLVRGGLLVDDSIGHIDTEVRQERGSKRWVKIEVEEVA